MQFLSGAPRDLDDHWLWTARYRMRAGEAFGLHRHPPAQIAWSPDGIVTVTVTGTVWVLTPGQALWIPPEVEHDLACRTDAVVHCAYVVPESDVIGWRDPTTFAVTSLIGELFALLAGTDVDPEARQHAEALFLRLVEPSTSTSAGLPVRLPRDARAREVATALLADPADPRTLEAWGRAVGASSRTLARAFVADTELTFTAWRTQARLCAALELLGAGQAPAQVARRVGYTNPRAFATAFRRTLGTTPQEFVA